MFYLDAREILILPSELKIGISVSFSEAKDIYFTVTSHYQRNYIRK